MSYQEQNPKPHRAGFLMLHTPKIAGNTGANATFAMYPQYKQCGPGCLCFLGCTSLTFHQQDSLTF